MLSARTPGSAKRVAAFTQLLAIYIAEKYKEVKLCRFGGLTPGLIESCCREKQSLLSGSWIDLFRSSLAARGYLSPT
jgi:hypothetical protein